MRVVGLRLGTSGSRELPENDGLFGFSDQIIQDAKEISVSLPMIDERVAELPYENGLSWHLHVN